MLLYAPYELFGAAIRDVFSEFPWFWKSRRSMAEAVGGTNEETGTADHTGALMLPLLPEIMMGKAVGLALTTICVLRAY